MKKADVKIGEDYAMEVNGRLVMVRIEYDLHGGGWQGTDLITKRPVRVSSAEQLSFPVEAKP